jgi:hypothetical protein
MRYSPNGTASIGIDSDYDYRTHKSPASLHDSPPPRPPTGSNGKHNDNSPPQGGVDGEEALLDLAQLEELHQEAERMKALGNKHMAAQVGTSKFRLMELKMMVHGTFANKNFFAHFNRNIPEPTTHTRQHCSCLPWVHPPTCFCPTEQPPCYP